METASVRKEAFGCFTKDNQAKTYKRYLDRAKKKLDQKEAKGGKEALEGEKIQFFFPIGCNRNEFMDGIKQFAKSNPEYERLEVGWKVIRRFGFDTFGIADAKYYYAYLLN